MKRSKQLNLKLPVPLESFLKRQLNAQLARYAASQAICCPQCGDVMDCTRTVHAELHRSADGHPEEVVRTFILCAKCWDKALPIIQEGINKAQIRSADQHFSGWMDIVDGRNYTDIL